MSCFPTKNKRWLVTACYVVTTYELIISCYCVEKRVDVDGYLEKRRIGIHTYLTEVVDKLDRRAHTDSRAITADSSIVVCLDIVMVETLGAEDTADTNPGAMLSTEWPLAPCNTPKAEFTDLVRDFFLFVYLF